MTRTPFLTLALTALGLLSCTAQASAAERSDLQYTPEEGTMLYTVQPGDTVSELAEIFETSIQTIVDTNALADADLIFVGEELFIRWEEPAVTAAPAIVAVAPEVVAEEAAPYQAPVIASRPVTHLGSFSVTYYSAYDGTQSGITAGGTSMAGGNVYTADGYRIIAADPSILPLGTVVSVTTADGQQFLAKVDDTGGAIRGNIIDIACSSPNEAFRLGRTTATLTIQ